METPAQTLVALTIAGFDPSSGAGVTADLQTFAAHGIFGTSAVTALTVQSTLGVAKVAAVASPMLRETLDYLCADLPPAGIKIGMLGSAENVAVVAHWLETLRARIGQVPLVCDPVLRSSSGRELLAAEGLDLFHAALLPMVDWLTPNWAELGALAGCRVNDPEEVERAASSLLERHPHLHLVVTGGDREQPVDRLFIRGHGVQIFAGEHVATTSTHGTGCAFSSALLAQVMKGVEPAPAVAAAKAYVAEALRRAPGLGHGRGPLHLLWPLHKPE